MEDEAAAAIEPGKREKTFTEKRHIIREWIFYQSELLVIMGPIGDC